MYNLPVCRLTDLGAVPNSIGGPWPFDQGPGWPAQASPCPCMSDAANITINGTTSYFRDYAGSGITDHLDKQITKYHRYAGSTTDTCYLSGPNQVDCADFLTLCSGVYTGPP